jgi:hypothetical protein
MLKMSAAFAALVLPVAIFAQGDAFQVRYASNLNVGDSVVNITNAGSAYSGSNPTGNLCVNVYAYNPDEEPISCCTCPITPNGLKSLSVTRDLISNPGLAERPATSVVIKLLATVPSGGGCNAAAPGSLAAGMRAWGTTLHRLPNGTYGVTETPFQSAALSGGELNMLTNQCSFFQNYASGHGICNSCATGGLLQRSALKTSLGTSKAN